MALGRVFERRWPNRLESFTLDGDITGKVTVVDTCGFFVKQKVAISATGLPNLNLEVKEVTTSTTLLVGPTTNSLNKSDKLNRGKSISARTDISTYTTALSAQIAAGEQIRPNIQEQYIMRAVYQEEPAVALRVMQVDKRGDPVGGGSGVASNINVQSWGGATTSLGQTVMGSSVPVAIASDQSPIPVTLDADLENIIPQYAELSNGAITGSTPGTANTIMTLTADKTLIVINNTLNRRIGVTIGGSQWLELENNQNGVLNLGSNGKKIISGSIIGIFFDAISPSKGRIAVSMV